MTKEQKLRKQADKLWQQICQSSSPNCIVCGNKTQVAHHWFPKSIASSLRYVISNGVQLCNRCHFMLHNGDVDIPAKILKINGQKWHNKLVELRKTKISVGVKYYENIIENLTSIWNTLKEEKEDF